MTPLRFRSFASVGVSLFTLFIVVFFGASSLSAQEAAAEKDRPVKKSTAKENPMKGQTRELTGEQFLSHDPMAPTPQMLQMMQMQLAQNKAATFPPIQGPFLMGATYHFGNADKETVPVLLLHGMGGSRRDFTPLADTLANAGFAVLVPDLRGHGASRKRYEIAMANYTGQQATQAPQGMNLRTIAGPTGTMPSNRKLVDVKPEDVLPKEFIDSAKYDLPLFRDTLLKLHDRGLVNMNRLVIIGIERGAALAAYQTMQDWAEKDSPRCTKTLIMIAPVDLDPTMDTARLFEGNKWIGNGLAAMFINPQGSPMSQTVIGNIRTTLLGKNAAEDKGGMESKYPTFSYVPEKKVKGEKGETSEPLTWAETFSTKNTDVTKVIVDFINKRNAAFKGNEARWGKIK